MSDQCGIGPHMLLRKILCPDYMCEGGSFLQVMSSFTVSDAKDIVGEENNFPSTLLSSSRWCNNQIDMRQINRGKYQVYDVCTYGSFIRLGARTHQTYMLW